MTKIPADLKLAQPRHLTEIQGYHSVSGFAWQCSGVEISANVNKKSRWEIKICQEPIFIITQNFNWSFWNRHWQPFSDHTFHKNSKIEPSCQRSMEWEETEWEKNERCKKTKMGFHSLHCMIKNYFHLFLRSQSFFTLSFPNSRRKSLLLCFQD